MKNDDFEKYNILYGNLKEINDKLRIKANRIYKNAKFMDVVDFALTGFGMSLIKSIYYDNITSLTNALILRNIIEYLALRELYNKKQITKDNEILLRYEGYIVDYYLYSERLKDIKDKIIIDKEKLQKDFDAAKEVYLSYGKDEKYIKFNNFRFLLKNNITYKKIIDKYLPRYSSYYDMLSVLIHPHDLNSIETDKYLIESTCFILYELEQIYFNPNIEKEKLFNYEYSRIYSFDIELPDNHPLHLKKYINSQIKLLESIRDASIKVNGEQYFLNNVLIAIERILLDITSDSLHGLCESCKIKSKVIFEFFSVYYKLLFNNPNQVEQCKLFALYTDIQEKRILGQSYNIDEPYNLFKEIYPKSKLNKEQFENAFNNNLGFLINEEGKAPKFETIVKEMLEKIYKDAKVQNVDYNLKDFVFLEYIESITMGHSNGYLYFANSGAFKDGINILIQTDFIIYNFLKLLTIYEKLYSNGRSKKYFNALNNNMKRYDELMQYKTAIYLIPQVEKTF